MSNPSVESALAVVRGGLRRRLGAVAVSLGGAVLVLGTLLAMNQLEALDKKQLDKQVASFKVERKAKPPPSRKPKPKPKPKSKPRKAAAPLPDLGVSLSGVDFGLPGLGDALADATNQLLGDVQDVVMTEEAVDEAPVPAERTAAPYPSRARAKGIEGYVSVSMLVDADGRVKDVEVLESQPAGVFDESATSALRTWRFQPAMYEGRAVAVRVRQTLRFALE